MIEPRVNGPEPLAAKAPLEAMALRRPAPASNLTKLICPDCRVEIVQTSSECHCPNCGKTFPYRHGILSFLTSADTFNEGEFEEKQKQKWSDSAALRQKVSRSRFLSLLNTLRIKLSFFGRRDRLFYNEMAGGDKSRLILDLGCGGGRHYFCNYGKVIGVDPVLELLPAAKQLYSEVYHAGGYQLPFADDTFDYVVSSDVLGHIPFDKKDVLFAEMYRVLKKGGRAVHMIETDATNYWFRQAKKVPGCYERNLIDVPGHVGLELPTALRDRFLRHGFKEVRFIKLFSNLQPVGTLALVFSHELAQLPFWMRCLVRVDGFLGKSLLVREFLHLFMEPVVILEDFLTPLDHACGMGAVFEKTGARG
jgi:SAM-dependent methyltransferase